MSHYYFEGELVDPRTPGAVPSVTTILGVRNKPELNEWRLRVGGEAAYKRQTESADLGTRVHAACEQFVLGNKKMSVDEDVQPYLEGLKAWWDKYKPKFCLPEMFVHSEEYGYAGTIDLLCEIDGEDWILDFKTSARQDPEMGLQLRAYEQGRFEKTLTHSRTGILQLAPKGVKRGYRFTEYDEKLEVFLAHKTIYEWLNPNKSNLNLAGVTSGQEDY